MNNAPSTVGPDAAISPEVVEHVKSVAASMIGHAAFQKCDFDDICQDLFQQIILATPNFDPAKSSFATYACQIADRYKNRIYRERIYEKRDLPTIPFENRDEEPSQYEIDTAVNNVEHQCLIEDVHAVVASLSPIQKKFCTLILEGYSIRAAAKKCGINSWGGRYRESFINHIRDIFVQNGF